MKSLEFDSLFRVTYLHLYHLSTMNLEYSDNVIQAINKEKRIFEEDDELSFYFGRFTD